MKVFLSFVRLETIVVDLADWLWYCLYMNTKQNNNTKSLVRSFQRLEYFVQRKVVRMTQAEKLAFMQLLGNSDDPEAFTKLVGRAPVLLNVTAGL